MPKLRSLKIFLVILLALLACLLLWPIPDSLDVEADHSLKILDRNGKLLYEVRDDSPGSKEYIALSDIPPQLTDTLLAVEDRGFYGHMGFSPRAILRAAWQNFQAGEIVSGGSTITQQLVRIRLQPKERNYAYKLREIFYAFRLDLKLSKDEILESYLNSVYFGHQAYGLQAAARTFFDKNAMELSLAESTLLIGLIQSPSSYDPFVNFERAKARQKTVLNALAQNPDYSDLDKEALLNQKIKLSNGKISIRAPHFVMWLLDEWKNQMQPNEKNEVYTTLDLDLQSEIELIIENHLRDLEDRNVSSAAIVVLDTKTGEILAMIGSADYFDFEKDGSYNVALADRQPGSALKPFTYALALQKGDTLASTVADIETQFFTQEGNPYVPRNYDYGYHGLVRYREALANSYNISAVKVLEKVGVQELLNFLKELGLSTLSKSAEHYGLALTLG
ncbi:MAG: transglycosylase domain-containing protein, partial [Candidatus Peregrinibacteria bacterium]|nr:transglycosylase domain-containing protein [Candidatus Peregrinibacteria bacterium]